MPETFLTRSQRRALAMFARTGGDLDFDAEDTIGCHGAALWAVIDALARKGLVTAGLTYPLTEAGREALRTARPVSGPG